MSCHLLFVLAQGHFYQMIEHNQQKDTFARLYTTYLNTTGYCLEYHYWIIESGTLSVYVRGEDGVEVDLTMSTNTLVTRYWVRGFLRLPDGLHQIIIQGKTQQKNLSGIIIDDILALPCSQFSKWNFVSKDQPPNLVYRLMCGNIYNQMIDVCYNTQLWAINECRLYYTAVSINMCRLYYTAVSINGCRLYYTAVSRHWEETISYSSEYQ